MTDFKDNVFGRKSRTKRDCQSQFFRRNYIIIYTNKTNQLGVTDIRRHQVHR